MDAVLQQLFNGLSAGMGYAVIALGLTLVFGVLRVVNFAHGELYLLGGVTVVVASGHFQLPYALSIPLAALVAGGVAWVVDRVAVKPFLKSSDGEISALLATYAVSLLVLEGVLWARGPAPQRVEGITGMLQLGDIMLSQQRLWQLVIGAALLIGVGCVLKWTQFGRQLRAISQDAFAARVVGIDVAKAGSRTFVLAAAIAGVAGALAVPITLFTPMMGQHVIIKAFVVVVVGGMGSVTGAVVCGIAIGLVEAGLQSVVPSGTAQILLYSLMIVALLIRPQGLFGAYR